MSKILGATVEPWDTQASDRQGAVDGRLRYPDGHEGALEVTTIAVEADMQFLHTMAPVDFTWPSEADWWWSISVRSPTSMKRLKSVYEEIIRRCEAIGVTSPWHLPAEERRDRTTELHWLLYRSGAEFHGHPDVPNRRGDGTLRGVMVTPAGIGGLVDRRMGKLSEHLAEALQAPAMTKRVKKLLRDQSPERHLYARIEMTGLPFPSFDALLLGETLPPDPPPLPDGLTHLWLQPAFSTHVYLWSSTGWNRHEITGAVDLEDGDRPSRDG